jgi:hypothetical protein
MTRKEMEKEKKRVIENQVFSWDQSVGEPENAFSLFQLYLNLGHTRQYNKVYKLSKTLNYGRIRELAHLYNWKERAEDFDRAQDEEFRVKLNEEIIQSRIRQQRLGSEMQGIAAKGLAMFENCIDELSPTDVAKFLDIGVKIENLALGKSTEITESKIDATVSVAVEGISPELADRIGKELAIESSKKMDVD